LPPKHKLHSVPFDKCVIDLIGPWIIQVRKKPYEFNALIVIDIVFNLVELVRINEKNIHTCGKKICPSLVVKIPLAVTLCTRQSW
jgi:hypothetical protein